MTRAAHEPIPAYLAELRGALHGSRRRVDDMLREARGGLEDAAEAHLEEGASPAEAERLAVDEFGTVAEIAPAYQVELAATATRRSLLFLALLVPIGNISAWLQWRDAPPLAHQPPPGTFVLSLAVDILAWVVVAVAVAAVLAVTAGAKFIRFKPEYARLAGAVILTVLVLTFVSGLALTAAYAIARGEAPWPKGGDVPGVVYAVTWFGLTWCGIRCLRSGRRATLLLDAARTVDDGRHAYAG